MGEPNSKFSGLAPSSECMLVGLRKSLKYSSHGRTIDSAELSISPPTRKTVWTVFCFPLLSRQTIFKNLFSTDWKSCSVAPSNSSFTFFCFSDYRSCRSLGLMVSVCCLGSSTSLPCFVNLLLQLVLGLPPRLAPATLLPQLQAAALTMATQNMAHSDSMIPTTSRM